MSHSMSRGVAGIPWKKLKNLETCCEPTQHEKSRPSLAAISFSFGGLQPVEIPQNRQSFHWKSLQKTSGDLEKLAEKAGRRASIPPSLLPPATPRRRSRGQAALRGREGKFSYPQSLEKSRNGKILPGPPAVSPYDTDAPPGSTARGITARRPSRAPTGAARS